MATERAGNPVYKIIGFALAGLIVVQAVIFIIVLRPTFERDTPAKKIAARLAARFPDSDPRVTGPSKGVLRISLDVPFDPTVDAEEAHQCFQRVLATTRSPDLRGEPTIEITLRGAGLGGGATSAARTFNYNASGDADE